MTPFGLLLTDTHLSKENVDLVSDIFKQAIDYCLKNNIKTIYHGGDFFTSRNAQPLLVLGSALEIIENIEKNGLELVIIPGNHDKVDLEDKLSYLDPFRKHCHLIDEYEKIIINDELSLHFIPYFKEKTIYPTLLERASKNLDPNKNILITHITINGVNNNDGSKQENDISTNLFKSFHSVLVGHFHSYSKLSDNIYYIGSGYQSNFGEDNRKGFTILYDDGSHEFVKSKFPEFIKIKVNVDNTEILNSLEEQYSNSNDHIRFVLEGDEVMLSAFNKERFIDKGIDIKFEKNILVTKTNETKVYDQSNIKEIFKEFCEINSYDNTEIGSNYLKQIL
jgi:exonuclease SbcD